MSTAVVIAALAFVATPVAVLLMLRKEEPTRCGLMEIKCYICNKRIFVSERDPRPGLLAHFDTDEHKRNERERDA